MEEIYQRVARVKLIVFDVDGVLTDGRLYYSDDGQEFKAFHSRDGHGMKLLQQTGVKIGIITGRSSRVVEHRMTDLGVEHLFQGQQDKLPAFRALLDVLGLQPEEAAYVGDDVVDLPVMLRVGFAVAVQDASPLVKRHAHWLTPSAGGQGAAREVCELIMEAQGTLEEQLRRYYVDE